MLISFLYFSVDINTHKLYNMFCYNGFEYALEVGEKSA